MSVSFSYGEYDGDHFNVGSDLPHGWVCFDDDSKGCRLDRHKECEEEHACDLFVWVYANKPCLQNPEQNIIVDNITLL